jgi:nicotinic acid mononucleotide adenylyltransferase
MASFAEPVGYDVVFSYQGAFGPPTYGHYKSMDAFAKQLTSDFAGQKILMLFMPTAGGSKTHLLPTRDSRKKVLDKFCEMLKVENPNITFETSGIENAIFDDAATSKKTATIYTIDKLIETYKTSKICLGMGLDNAFQLPYWEKIDEYLMKVHKIYVVPRTPSAEELEKTRVFNVTNTDKSVVEMRFDVTVPWLNATFLKCFIEDSERFVYIETEEEDLTKPGETKKTKSCTLDGQQIIVNGKPNKLVLDNLTSVKNDGKEPYVFYQKLPPVQVLTGTPAPESASSSAPKSVLSIPATSSSMMRYFIGQYLNEKNKEETKEVNLSKVQKLMFGPTITEEQKLLVQDTITDYRDNVFINGVSFPENKDYDKEYAAIVGFAGGNRKSRRQQSQRKKRRSQRKKRRSQRK